MSDRKSGVKVENERRSFLRAGGLGALALLFGALFERKGNAAEVQYNRADLMAVNRKLRSSAAERRAFYANPQAYLKRYNIKVPNHMIPSRQQVEAALAKQPGKVMTAVASQDEAVVLLIPSAASIATGKSPAGNPATGVRIQSRDIRIDPATLTSGKSPARLRKRAPIKQVS